MKETKSSMKPFVLCSVLLSINEKDRGLQFYIGNTLLYEGTV